MLRRLRALTEDECQARLYGGTDEMVRRIELDGGPRPRQSDLSGERARQLFVGEQPGAETEAA